MLLSVGAFLWRIFAAGQAKEKARQREQVLRNVRERIKVDDEISSLSPSDQRKRLREWVRD